ANEALFREGDYVPLEADGERRDHVCAFARTAGGRSVVVAVPRLVLRLTGGQERLPLGPEVWRDTVLRLPEGRRDYRNVFVGEKLAGRGAEGLPLAEVFRTFPVAILTAEGAG